MWHASGQSYAQVTDSMEHVSLTILKHVPHASNACDCFCPSSLQSHLCSSSLLVAGFRVQGFRAKALRACMPDAAAAAFHMPLPFSMLPIMNTIMRCAHMCMCAACSTPCSCTHMHALSMLSHRMLPPSHCRHATDCLHVGPAADEGEFVNLQQKHNFSMAHFGMLLGVLRTSLFELQVLLLSIHSPM